MKKLKIHLISLICLLASINVPAQVVIDLNSQWSYFKGTVEPSVPNTLWKTNGFDDAGWLKGNAPFRYGDGSSGTLLSDMQNSYTTFYIRKEFTISDASIVDELKLAIDYDDGFAIWINGRNVLLANAPASFAYDQTATADHESGDIVNYTISKSSVALVNGTNIIAIQGFNNAKTSSDFYFNLKLEVVTRQPEAERVICDSPSGFYKYPFPAIISSLTAGETIKYTLDGSDPRFSATAITGTAPVTVVIDPNSTVGRGKTGGVVLRASKFVTGFAPSKPVSRSYIFVSAVKLQGLPGGNWPKSYVNGQTIDVGMDLKVTADSRYTNLMEDALLDIPSISVITDIDNLFGTDKGIYVNAGFHGSEWERPANIELIYPDGKEGFNIDAGIRIRGGWSRHDNYPKHAFRLFFRSEYGEGKLKYPLFEEEGVDEFDKIDLRTSQNYSWANGGDHSKYNTMNRDVFSRDCQRDMHQPYTRSRYYHLYLNGLYWGVYQTQERGEASFAASYLGGDKEDYDVIKVDIGDDWNLYEIEATEGNTDAWQEIWNISKTGFSSNAEYFKLLGLNAAGEVDTSLTVLVDIDNLIDYMLVIFYTGNFDAPVSKFSGNNNPNNFFAVYNRKKKREGFKFLIHDAEHTLLANAVDPGVGLIENRVNIGSTGYPRMNVSYFEKFHPQWLHFRLCQNAEYRMRFADRVYRHFFNNGVFNPSLCRNRFTATSDQLNLAIIAESARWGDAGNWPPRTKIDDWVPALNNVIYDYFPFRTNTVLIQLLDENLYVSVKPPVFKNDATIMPETEKIITTDFNLTLENPTANGTIIYTIDNTDPRAVGGAISNTAIDGGTVKNIVVTPGTHLKARVKYVSQWSALHEIYFHEGALFSDLKVTELFYHPKDNGVIDGEEYEFIEFKNIGNTTIDLSNLRFTDGIQFTFPAGSTLKPSEFVVIAANKTVFTETYGFAPDFVYTGKLANSGEKLVLQTITNRIVLSFAYSDGSPWPKEADGDGYSLISIDKNPTGNPNLPEYWTISKKLNGSPKSDDLMSDIAAPITVLPELNVYPNPTNSAINIDFFANDYETIQIGLYDLSGRLIRQLVNENLPEGKHHKTLQLGSLGIESGVYLVRYQSANSFTAKKVIYIGY